MNRDLRDPKLLGERLLEQRPYRVKELELSYIADTSNLQVKDYSANPGTLEKYGRPQDLPSTLPN